MDFVEARRNLLKDLSTAVPDGEVLRAMSRVPREYFVPPGLEMAAYDDRPLPIGLGQTISQPLMIALMTRALGLSGREKVLEVGSGSGYQTAILAELAGKVISLERLPRLAEQARERLAGLGYKNVEIRVAGRGLGWPGEAPYDAIMVTAGAPSVPRSLLRQMKDGGRMVIPVGTQRRQKLYRITRRGDKNLAEDLGGCRFVPLIAEEAWPEKRGS